MQSVDRIIKLPIIETSWDYVGKTYFKIKQSSSVVNWAMIMAEDAFTTMMDSAAPTAILFDTPIKALDQVLCKTLDIVEEKVPSVKLPPENIYENAKQYATDVGKTIVRPVLKRADSFKSIGNTVLSNKYTELAADTLDGALDVADKYVEKYLPEDETDKDSKMNNENDNSNSGKAIKTIHHIDNFSRKLQRRLTRRALAEAAALKEQSTEAVHVLIYVLELIAKDPVLALQKGKELWISLSKDEPENQARPENLEQLLVMIVRETARRVVHLINFVLDIGKNISLTFFNKNKEILDSLTKSLQQTFVSQPMQQITKQAAQLLQFTNTSTIKLLDQFSQLLNNIESSSNNEEKSNSANAKTPNTDTANTNTQQHNKTLEGANGV